MPDCDLNRIYQIDRNTLGLAWADGRESRIPVRDLRIQCPCAHCVDEVTGERILDEDLVLEDVHPVTIEPVGRYALRIHWSDGHDTGIYPFERLRALCPCEKCAGSGGRGITG